MTITDLEERRRAAAEPKYDGIVCGCGEAWFELRPGPKSPTVAVCLGKDGTVTGYAGEPHCLSCGVPVSLPGLR
jgi:hypothetical protein